MRSVASGEAVPLPATLRGHGRFSGNNRVMIFEDSGLTLVDLSRGSARDIGPAGTAATLSDDGARLFQGFSDGQVACCWNTRTAEQIWRAKAHADRVTVIRAIGDGAILVTGAQDGSLQRLDSNSGSMMSATATIAHESAVSCLTFLGEGETFVSGSWDGTVKLWQTHNGKLERTLTQHRGSITRIASGSQGERLLTGSQIGELFLWDLSSGEVVYATRERGAVRQLGFGADDGYIYAMFRPADPGPDAPTTIWSMAAHSKP